MKLMDKLINFIFSLAMLVISVVVLLVIFNFISSSYIMGLMNEYVWNKDYHFVVALTSIIIFLAGLKTTIFLSDFKKKRKIPIMVSSENGNIQIAGETIETTAKTVALTHEEVKDVNVKMVNKNKGVELYMSLLMVQDTNIREITKQIQEEVKEKIADTTGVTILNIDIKVKNIVEKNKKVVQVIKEEPLVVKGKLEKEEPVPEPQEIEQSLDDTTKEEVVESKEE